MSGSNSTAAATITAVQQHRAAAAAAAACIYIYVYLYVYTLLSPDTTRPPSRVLAHSGARYEIWELRDIYGAGRRHSAGSSRGCSSCGGARSAPFCRGVRRTLAPRSSLEIRVDPSLGAGPSQNGTCLGGGIGSMIRAGRTTACYNIFSVRQDSSLYNAN